MERRWASRSAWLVLIGAISIVASEPAVGQASPTWSEASTPVEAAADVGEPEMAHLERDSGVGGIEAPHAPGVSGNVDMWCLLVGDEGDNHRARRPQLSELSASRRHHYAGAGARYIGRSVAAHRGVADLRRHTATEPFVERRVARVGRPGRTAVARRRRPRGMDAYALAPEPVPCRRGEDAEVLRVQCDSFHRHVHVPR